MGLFDQLGNLSPEQSQGLLAAAAQMLQQSGPSLRPTGLGQIAGGGLQAYQASTIDAKKRKMEEDAAAQAQQMRGLQMQDLQGQLADRGIMRNRQAQINAALAGGDATTEPQQQPGGTIPAQQMASVMPGGAMSPKIGGPDWMQAYQQQQGSQLPSAAATSQGQLSPPQNIAQAQADRLMKEAAVYSKFGDFDGADKRYQAAAKLLPEVNKIETGMRNGTPVRVITFKDGSEKVSEFSPAEKLTFQNTGGKTLGLNPLTGAQVTSFNNTQSPDSVASNSLGRARLAFDKDQAETNQDETMDPLAVRLTAQQYLAGDTSALQNFGRGAQGAKNLNAVRLEITKQANAQGLNGADVAAKIAEFGGIKAGQRTAGTRSANIEIAANEADQLAPLALDASQKVSRSGLLPFGKAQIMFDSNTNDPNMRQFAMANTALVNAYGQVMSRGGKATDSDKKHASDLLSTAFDQPSYAAAVAQLQQEIKAAQKAPRQVREDLSNATSGRDKPSASALSVTAPNGKTYTFQDAKSLANFKLSAGIP